jgi:hypothetical protein
VPLAQTESSSSTYVPTIDEIVAMAYRRAGLLNTQQSPSTAQGAVARQVLSVLTTALEAEGIAMRAVQPGYVTLAEGQNLYTLPENVIDCVGNGAYIDPTVSQVPFQASSETPVIKTDRDTYQNLSSKSAESRPTLYYFARQAPLGTLYVWPTPSASEAGGQIRFQFHQLRPDVTDGQKTMPFERYWDEYFVYALAGRLAFDNSMALDRVGYLDQTAAGKKDIAKGYSKQNVTMQASINHRTGWSRNSRR